MRRAVVDESEPDSVELSRPTDWKKIVSNISSAVDDYLTQHLVQNDDGYNRAMNIKAWIASGKTEDTTFCFKLLCAIFAISDPTIGSVKNFFSLFARSYSKRLAKMIAEKLITGRYVEITCFQQVIKNDRSCGTLSSTSFDATSLRDSITPGMGQSYGSEMESRSEYVKENGVRYMLREELRKMPEIQQKEYMKEIRALEALMVKPYVTTEPEVALRATTMH